MKNLIIILSFAFLPLITSCQKSPSLVGTWEFDKKNNPGYSAMYYVTFTFKEDGSCSQELFGQIFFKADYKLSIDGSEVAFYNVKISHMSSDDEITWEDSKEYVLSVILLTDLTLKLGSYRHEGESVGKNKDYIFSWKKI